jgi:hypothetical protein
MDNQLAYIFNTPTHSIQNDTSLRYQLEYQTLQCVNSIHAAETISWRWLDKLMHVSPYSNPREQFASQIHKDPCR